METITEVKIEKRGDWYCLVYPNGKGTTAKSKDRGVMLRIAERQNWKVVRKWS